jgi:hypothetical protein
MKSMHCNVAFLISLLQALRLLAAVSTLLCDLKNDFALKDLEPLHYFLGIEVQHVSDGIHLSQTKYTSDLLHRPGMVSCKHTTMPLSSSNKLLAHQGDLHGPEDATMYCNMVGDLQYLTLTRSDISFSINKVC